MDQLVEATARTLDEVSRYCRENATAVSSAFARYNGDEGYDWANLPPLERKARVVAEARAIGVAVSRFTLLMSVMSAVKREEAE